MTDGLLLYPWISTSLKLYQRNSLFSRWQLTQQPTTGQGIKLKKKTTMECYLYRIFITYPPPKAQTPMQKNGQEDCNILREKKHFSEKHNGRCVLELRVDRTACTRLHNLNQQ